MYEIAQWDNHDDCARGHMSSTTIFRRWQRSISAPRRGPVRRVGATRHELATGYEPPPVLLRYHRAPGPFLLHNHRLIKNTITKASMPPAIADAVPLAEKRSLHR